ncbi:MAG: hypothetical protein AAGF11_18090 [Myxococcota bacterium]
MMFSKRIRNVSCLLGLATTALSSGCAGQFIEDWVDSAFEATELSGPFEGKVVVDDELDGGLVRAGFFPKVAVVPVELEDGTVEQQEVHLRVSTPNEGRVRLERQITLDGDGEPAEDAFEGTAMFPPLTVGDEVGDAFQLSLPSEADDEVEYVMAAWYDANNDGLLSISQSGDSEVIRVFRNELEGQEYMFTDLNCRYDEDDVDALVWKGRAIHWDEGNMIDTAIVEDDWPAVWIAELPADLEPPVK